MYSIFLMNKNMLPIITELLRRSKINRLLCLSTKDRCKPVSTVKVNLIRLRIFWHFSASGVT